MKNINAGYTIIDHFAVGEQGFALGESETAPSPYVTWQYRLAQRADEVRSGNVEPHIDNMLRITNDGRKLALDQRLLNPLLPDDTNSKSAACASKVFHIWHEGKEKGLAQLVFCDNSTPKADAFDVYNDVKNKLTAKGVPESEIAFIHDANSDAQKAALFSQVRAGQVRVLLGSTAKMGAGTNVQKLLVGEHHIDCPWRPADIEQREGRIIRQGNENPKGADIPLRYREYLRCLHVGDNRGKAAVHFADHDLKKPCPFLRGYR